MMAALATLHLAPDRAGPRLPPAGGRRRPPGSGSSATRSLDAVRRDGHDPGAARDSRRGVLRHRAPGHQRRRPRPARRAWCDWSSSSAAQHGGVLFPMHPRTRDRLVAAGLWDGLTALAGTTGVTLVEPLPYGDLLARWRPAGSPSPTAAALQEEASYLGRPGRRHAAQRPRAGRACAAGAAVLTGLDEVRVLEAASRLADAAELARIAALPCPYGDGRTAERVVEVLDDPEVRALLGPRRTPPAQRPAGTGWRRDPGRRRHRHAQSRWTSTTPCTRRPTGWPVPGTPWLRQPAGAAWTRPPCTRCCCASATKVPTGAASSTGPWRQIGVPADLAAELVPSLVAVFAGHRPARLRPYPGAVEALGRLAERLPVVVVTDGMPADPAREGRGAGHRAPGRRRRGLGRAGRTAPAQAAPGPFRTGPGGARLDPRRGRPRRRPPGQGRPRGRGRRDALRPGGDG